jgi:hypothetical protein
MRAFRLLTVSAAAVCLIAPSTADAQDGWRQVYRDAQMNVAIDTGRVGRAGDGAYTVVMRWNYASPRRAESRKQYSRLIQQVQVRCTPAPIRVKRFGMALYTATGTLVEEARPLNAGEIRLMDWERLRPRSEGSRVYPAVCTTLASLNRRRA